MLTLAILAQKGGTGKTTLSIHLTVQAALKKKKVVLCDLDPQGSASAWYSLRKKKNFPLVKATASNLHGALQAARQDQYDFALIDCPPSLANETRLAAQAAQLAVLVTTPNLLDLQTVAGTIRLLSGIGTPVVVVLNKCPAVRLGKETAQLKEARSYLKHLNVRVWEGNIPLRMIYSNACITGETACEVESDERSAKEIQTLYQWLRKLASPGKE